MNQRKYFLLTMITIILFFVLISGCTEEKAVIKTFNESNSGETVNIENGEIFHIQLFENPSTGYSWNMTYTEGLELMSDEYTQSNTTEQIVGAGGTHDWEFKAIKTGEQQIKGIYHRPWEGINESINYTTFELIVKVA
ncbi:proteinase inhibitor [Methanocella sp. CWC-04]|uniref:Proteinase inhibitor n=1 Tax=Methanooceanicella nereidis TaxID=2052831 RepID=A0AAP2W4S0_9EURY|nr:protease inhibitor I42 family protein [Methanocella sp. CWC-04]MCD1293562.1 proteinase inhibitor [Methanocella sp. CWC-04]